MPRAELSLSAGWLVLGRVVPRALEMDGIRLRATRERDGRMSVDLAGKAEDAAGPQGWPARVLPELLGDLARPAQADHDAQRSLWSELHRVRITDAALVVEDRQLARRGAPTRSPSTPSGVPGAGPRQRQS